MGQGTDDEIKRIEKLLLASLAAKKGDKDKLSRGDWLRLQKKKAGLKLKQKAMAGRDSIAEGMSKSERGRAMLEKAGYGGPSLRPGHRTWDYQ